MRYITNPDGDERQKDRIGGVWFDEDLVVVSDVPVTTGYNRKAIDGTIIAVTVGQRPDTRASWIGTKMKVLFDWESWHTVEKLMDLQITGAAVSFWVDGRTGTCILDQIEGVSNVKHASGEYWPVTRVLGTTNDIWSGEVTFYVLG